MRIIITSYQNDYKQAKESSVMSHVKEIQARNKAYTRIVLRLTGLSIDELVEIQMDIALQYLDNMLGDDPIGIEYVYQDEMFWKWFINGWHKRDADEFVKTLYGVDANFRREKYRLMHFNWCVVRHQRPQMPQQLLNDMYLKTMGITAKVELVKIK